MGSTPIKGKCKKLSISKESVKRATRVAAIVEITLNLINNPQLVSPIQSLRPESIVEHIDLYLEIMFSKSELSRAEREMMAVVVTVCRY